MNLELKLTELYWRKKLIFHFQHFREEKEAVKRTDEKVEREAKAGDDGLTPIPHSKGQHVTFHLYSISSPPHTMNFSRLNSHLQTERTEAGRQASCFIIIVQEESRENIKVKKLKMQKHHHSNRIEWIDIERIGKK